MDPSIHLFLYLLAGLTLGIAAINLTVGLRQKDDNAYLFLGMMGLFVGIYYLLFPLEISASNGSLFFHLGMLFFLANFALVPWFLGHYTGYCKIPLQWTLSGGMILTFLLLIFQPEEWHFRVWNVFGHIVLIGIIGFGFKAARYQYYQGEKSSARLLYWVLVILSILTIDDIFRVYFKKQYPFVFHPDVLPLDYFLVFFMILMGLRLARDMQRKYQLEKTINIQEAKWSNLLNEVELIVVGLDPEGKVIYVNPFFTALSGYDEQEVIGRDWFDSFLPPSNRSQLKEVFQRSLSEKPVTKFTNVIVNRAGEEIMISWSNVIVRDKSGSTVMLLAVGADISKQEQSMREIEELKRRLEEENILLRSELGKEPLSGKILGDSDALQYVLHRSLQVAETDSTVLLEGETGVGKDLVANFIQQNSLRKAEPFIKINCASIPSTLLESELFGYVKGAFTGAHNNKRGLVEMADKGTLFLDEVGEFPLELQPKLLRFLQDGEYLPLGSTAEKKVDVRIIAATNKVLLKEIEKGNFRNDLYYRLYVYPITLPPLRERKEDIPVLAEMFVHQFASKHRKKIKKVSTTVIEELKKYPWPGNIRELENVLERAVIVCQGDTIKLRDLGPVVNPPKNPVSSSEGGIKPLVEAEKQCIRKALEETRWKIHGPGGAAELLRINPSTLRSRMKKLNITR